MDFMQENNSVKLKQQIIAQTTAETQPTKLNKLSVKNNFGMSNP